MTPLDDDELLALARRALAEPAAPAPWLARAVALWPAAAPGSAAAEALRAGWRVVQAVLSFDSWAQPALAGGMRGGGAVARHLLFTAEGRDVDLRITEQAGAWQLAGQVLGPDEQGEFELRGDLGTRSAALDGLGEFRLDDLPAGHYRLCLRLAGTAVELPPIEIGPRP